MLHVNVVELAAAIGSVLPLLAAVLKQDHFAARTNAIIAAAVSVVAAVVTCAAKGTLSAADLGGSLAAVYAVAQATYAGLWKPTGLEPWLKAVTSLRIVRAVAPVQVAPVVPALVVPGTLPPEAHSSMATPDAPQG